MCQIVSQVTDRWRVNRLAIVFLQNVSKPQNTLPPQISLEFEGRKGGICTFITFEGIKSLAGIKPGSYSRQPQCQAIGWAKSKRLWPLRRPIGKFSRRCSKRGRFLSDFVDFPVSEKLKNAMASSKLRERHQNTPQHVALKRLVHFSSPLSQFSTFFNFWK